MPDDVLSAALRAAETGWPVFVLGRRKRPVANCRACPSAKDDPMHDREACRCLTCHGFYAATTDPHRIRAMLRTVRGGMLAIRTGAPAGLVVVDIDPDHGGALDTTLMPPTHTVRTGSGGWHLYYSHPGWSVPSRPMPGRVGIDIKADGGYVAIPPSRHPRTCLPYRTVGRRPVVEMPPPLAAVLLAPAAPTGPAHHRPHPAPSTATTTPPGGGGISSPAALLAAHLRSVARAPEGKRRTTLYGAARGVARMVAAGALTADAARAALTEVGRAAEQTDRDIRAAIAGGFTAEGVPT
jgi:hypothetical protein